MKKVLSVSLGSRTRDHAVTVRLLGEDVQIERRGTDGDFDRAIALYREFDGVVDAFGVGGIEFFIPVADRHYYWRDAKRIRQAIRVSKAGDGNGVRAILSRRAIGALEHRLNAAGRSLHGMKALKTTAVARYFMALDLVEAGCDVTFGDFMFALELPIPLRTLAGVRALGRVLLPPVTQLPYRWLYSLGDEQTRPPVPKWGRYYAEAQIIAGDFLQIRSHMPQDLRGKIILTNTTTKGDVDDLRARGVHLLVTETPRLEGRSFGTNVMEALLLSLIDKPQEQVTRQDFEELIGRIPLEPSIEVLNPMPSEFAPASITELR
jgi:hypothetical protein